MKPNQTLTLAACALGALCCTQAAFAAGLTHDGTINFTGKVVKSTCKIEPTPVSVDLGTKSTSFFNNLGNDESDRKDVVLNIKDCGADENGHLAFSGTRDPHTPNLFAATGPENMGVALYDPNGTQINATDSATASTAAYNGTPGAITLQAAMHKNGGGDVGPGDLSSTINVDFFPD